MMIEFFYLKYYKTGSFHLNSNDNNNSTNIINNQNGFRSSSFKVNQSLNNTTTTTRQIPITVITSNNTNTPSSQSSYHQNHYSHQQQQQNRYSDLSSLSLLNLKKGISASSSFQNKVNLYSNNQLSDISIDPEPSLNMQQSTHSASSPLGYHYHTEITNQQPHQTSMENLLTTVPSSSRRPLSTNLNTANINRFIRPKLAVNASSTSTSNLANTSSSSNSSCGGDVFKPPLPQQSRSTFSTCFLFCL